MVSYVPNFSRWLGFSAPEQTATTTYFPATTTRPPLSVGNLPGWDNGWGGPCQCLGDLQFTLDELNTFARALGFSIDELKLYNYNEICEKICERYPLLKEDPFIRDCFFSVKRNKHLFLKLSKNIVYALIACGLIHLLGGGLNHASSSAYDSVREYTTLPQTRITYAKERVYNEMDNDYLTKVVEVVKSFVQIFKDDTKDVEKLAAKTEAFTKNAGKISFFLLDAIRFLFSSAAASVLYLVKAGTNKKFLPIVKLLIVPSTYVLTDKSYKDSEEEASLLFERLKRQQNVGDNLFIRFLKITRYMVKSMAKDSLVARIPLAAAHKLYHNTRNLYSWTKKLFTRRKSPPKGSHRLPPRGSYKTLRKRPEYYSPIA